MKIYSINFFYKQISLINYLFSKKGKNCYHQIQKQSKGYKMMLSAKILDFNDGSYKYSSEL